jgi:hypothetical protein
MVKTFRRITLAAAALVAAAGFGACSLLGDGPSGADLKVANRTGRAIRLVAGDFDALADRPDGVLAADLPAGADGVAFRVPCDETVNLWYRDSSNSLTLLVYSGETARDFLFAANKSYTLTLNASGYNLADGAAPISGNTDTASWSRAAVSRTAPVAGLADSVAAAGVTPLSAALIRESGYGGDYFRLVAEFRYDQPAGGPASLSFIKVRPRFLDVQGNQLFLSTAASDGFVYTDAYQTTRYYSSYDSTYNYCNYTAMAGDRVYLETYWYIGSADSANPLFGLRPGDVATVEFSVVGSVYTSLAHAPVPAAIGLEAGAGTLNASGASYPLTNRSATDWWQVEAYSCKVVFFDADDRIVAVAAAKPAAGSDSLFGPGESGFYAAAAPTYAAPAGIAAAKLALPYEPGVPVGSARGGAAYAASAPEGPAAAALRSAARQAAAAADDAAARAAAGQGE